LQGVPSPCKTYHTYTGDELYIYLIGIVTKDRKNKIPNAQNPECLKSRTLKIPNTQNPERLKIPNAQNPEYSKSRILKILVKNSSNHRQWSIFLKSGINSIIHSFERILILRLRFPKDFWLPDPNPASDF
jgi:hypothetical protein